MVKVKRLRTADCVVGGLRYESHSRKVGSLLLGLYDAEGRLNHVGFMSTIAERERAALTRRLEALREPPGFTGKAPGGPSRRASPARRRGGPSRWSTERSGEWEPVRPDLIVEVRYDHVSLRPFQAQDARSLPDLLGGAGDGAPHHELWLRRRRDTRLVDRDQAPEKWRVLAGGGRLRKPTPSCTWPRPSATSSVCAPMCAARTHASICQHRRSRPALYQRVAKGTRVVVL